MELQSKIAKQIHRDLTLAEQPDKMATQTDKRVTTMFNFTTVEIQEGYALASLQVLDTLYQVTIFDGELGYRVIQPNLEITDEKVV